MQYYFSNYFHKNVYRSQYLIFSFFIIFISSSISTLSAAPINSPLDTTLVIEKDIYPKVVNRQERLIEGKKYVFATINERKGMVALSGNFLSEMARAAGIEVTDFLDWNDMKPTDAIKTGQVYYLQEKGNRAKDVATHILMPNETLWDVAQKYAMQYKYLLKYNRLDDEDKVKMGRVLWLQTKRPKRVPIEVRDVTPIVATFEENEEEEEEIAADPELMAEWEELKKTELAGMDKEKTNTTTKTKDNTSTATNTENSNKSEQGSFAEFENDSKTDDVVVTEKTDTKTDTKVTTNVVKYHTVAEAESLYDISKKYNVVMSTLKEWNNLPDYTISTGQKLIVSQPNGSQNNKVYEGTLVTEKIEDKQVGTATSDKKVVVKQNGNGDFATFIDSSGVLLPIPQKDFTPVQPSIDTENTDYHIVEKDETLWSIARKYNLSPKDLILWNGFVIGDNIDVGDKIILKSSLAVPAGSRSEIEKNNSSSSTTSNTESSVAGGTEFKDTAISGAGSEKTEATADNSSQSKTDASKLSRADIISMGGNPDNVGKEGYDELGTPIVGYDFSKKKTDSTKTKTEETQTKAEIYVVQPQDMLGKIAQKHNVTTKELMAWNPKTAPNGTIHIGDTLFVSQPQTTKTVTEETTTVYPFDYYGSNFHVVQPKETIFHLSDRYIVPHLRILEWNKLDANTIDLPVGSKIIVNEAALKMASGNNTDTSKKEEKKNPDATAQVNYSYHSVEKGDTLFSIAQKYNLSTAQVREWNNRQGDLVYEGEKLIIGVK